MTSDLFIFGYGFSSQAIAEKSADQFSKIWGTSRSQEKARSLSSFGIEGLVFDGETITPELSAALAQATHLVISIAPGEEDPVLKALGYSLKQLKNLEWIGYLSTVGVYGNHDGKWVDEETPPKPVSKRSVQRVNAENAWIKAAEEANVPWAIFRLSGIYGPGRNTFTTIKAGKSRRLVKPGQVFNRIHREDIGQAVSQAMKKNSQGIFNITDNHPAPPQDLVTLAHELMGLAPPPEIEFETADLTPMARSFYGENKRVKNAKSKEILNFDYAWPDYKTALNRMWKEGSWK